MPTDALKTCVLQNSDCDMRRTCPITRRRGRWPEADVINLRYGDDTHR